MGRDSRSCLPARYVPRADHLKFITIPRGWYDHPPFQRRGSDPTLGRQSHWLKATQLAPGTQFGPTNYTEPRHFLSLSQLPRSPGFHMWQTVKAIDQKVFSKHLPCSLYSEVCQEFTETETCRNWPKGNSEKAQGYLGWSSLEILQKKQAGMGFLEQAAAEVRSVRAHDMGSRGFRYPASSAVLSRPMPAEQRGMKTQVFQWPLLPTIPTV